MFLESKGVWSTAVVLRHVSGGCEQLEEVIGFNPIQNNLTVNEHTCIILINLESVCVIWSCICDNCSCFAWVINLFLVVKAQTFINYVGEGVF